MISLSKDNNAEFAPLTWRKVMRDGQPRATMVCANGHYGALVDHTISQDGTVTPSVVCPVTGCGFHEYVRLDGWTG